MTLKPTTQRGVLYGLAAFLVPWTEKVVPVLMQNEWPTPQSCVASVILGVAAAVIALRAFIDGSVERGKPAKGVTEFVRKDIG